MITDRFKPEAEEEERFVAFTRDGSAEQFMYLVRAGVFPGLRFGTRQVIHRHGWWLWADPHNWARLEDMRRAYSAGWHRVQAIPTPELVPHPTEALESYKAVLEGFEDGDGIIRNVKAADIAAMLVSDGPLSHKKRDYR